MPDGYDPKIAQHPASFFRFKETAKTALQVGTTLAGIGYLGAIGYKHCGTLGSLTGITLGTGLGSLAPKAITNLCNS